jgi:amino acid transporter
MSEAAQVPCTEDKTGDAPERLHRGALDLIDISASTMANIGPACSFYFGFAGIVIAAGLASPLVVLAAIVAIALLGDTLSQFSRAHPSTGGFITFVGKTFGGTSAVTTALLCGAGSIIVIASVMVISGGFLSMMLQCYFSVSIPWIIFSARRRGHVHDVPRRRGVDQAGGGSSSASKSRCCWSCPSPR